MPEYNEVAIVHEHQNTLAEEGIVVPLDRINPETLRRLVEEFVTREWSGLPDTDCTFEDKTVHVMQQLKSNRVKVVFDLTSETCNIVAADSIPESQR
ncbi:MAG: YheU family protein [Desulfuromonadaceae bacterium]|nr:YheU family protein [Desulfuromonadaceae bacterium]